MLIVRLPAFQLKKHKKRKSNNGYVFQKFEFNKKYMSDLNFLLVHGEKMAEVKVEPIISEDNFQ